MGLIRPSHGKLKPRGGMAMAMFSGPWVPRESVVMEAVERMGLERFRVFDFEDDGFTFEREGRLVVAQMMPTKVQGLVSDLVDGRVDWTDGMKPLDGHQAHMIFASTSMSDTSEAMNVAIDLTYAIGATAMAPEFVAGLWSDSLLIQNSETWLDECAEASLEYLPLILWIRPYLFKEDDGTLSAATAGMRGLGHFELEIRNSELEPIEILNELFVFARYCLGSGNTVRHGETIGMSAEHKLRVRISKPRMADGKWVMVIG